MYLYLRAKKTLSALIQCQCSPYCLQKALNVFLRPCFRSLVPVSQKRCNMHVSDFNCFSKNTLLSHDLWATNCIRQTTVSTRHIRVGESLPDSIKSLFKVNQVSLLFRRLSSMALISKKGQLQSGNLAEHRHQQSLLRHKSSPSELHAT